MEPRSWIQHDPIPGQDEPPATYEDEEVIWMPAAQMTFSSEGALGGGKGMIHWPAL